MSLKPLRSPESFLTGGSIPPAKRRGSSSVWWWLLALPLGAVVVGIAVVVAGYQYYSRGLPTVESLRNYRPPQTSFVLDRDGKTLGEIYTERRTVVSMAQVPRHLVLAVLAAEDADFYQHEGLDYVGLFRATYANLVAGRVSQGASTITQQTVKVLLLNPERTLERKVKQLILSRRLEANLSKEEILHLYLNHINFGHARYGVQEASRFYFGIDVDDLSLAQAALLAGLPQAPTRHSPKLHPKSARRRQLYVLRQLEEKRELYWPDLGRDEIQRARKADWGLQPYPGVPRAGLSVLAEATKFLRGQVSPKSFKLGGYRVATTIDLDKQQMAFEALRAGLRAHDERRRHQGPIERRRSRLPRRHRPKPLKVGRYVEARVVGHRDAKHELLVEAQEQRFAVPCAADHRYNPKHLAPSEFAELGVLLFVRIEQLPEEEREKGQGGRSDETGAAEQATEGRASLAMGPQGALLAMDVASREILAMVGGYEGGFGYNRATQALRQPGSTFKPVVYGLALKSRSYTPATLVLDAPAVYDKWKPNNYERWRFEGHLRLRQALAKSINLVAVRVVESLGPEAVADFARQLGFTTHLEPTLSIGLGANSVRLPELVNAYATIGAGGTWAQPLLISKVTDAQGEVIYSPPPKPSREVLSPAEAYVLTSMLQSVVREGTGGAARKLGRPAAGKTGTSNRLRDAWFVGFTPELVTGVWVGYDDRRSLGRHQTGGSTAAPIWTDFMTKALAGQPVRSFEKPEGVVTVAINPETGQRAAPGTGDAFVEVFLEGTEPQENAASTTVDTNSFLLDQIEKPTDPR